ncbi:hypothetical protein EJ08DRAFT_462870 [Tothia fuscella]|uniref:Uncharacterized protein n=1 Tax=Tothia fuscella TaxID=1048955 RepID=A0A9P4NIY2_9PEZI|nr:hypothetical protein EJ08DRAFT_462870 [Tothia fuscella]
MMTSRENLPSHSFHAHRRYKKGVWTFKRHPPQPLRQVVELRRFQNAAYMLSGGWKQGSGLSSSVLASSWMQRKLSHAVNMPNGSTSNGSGLSSSTPARQHPHLLNAEKAFKRCLNADRGYKQGVRTFNLPYKHHLGRLGCRIHHQEWPPQEAVHAGRTPKPFRATPSMPILEKGDGVLKNKNAFFAGTLEADADAEAKSGNPVATASA